MSLKAIRGPLLSSQPTSANSLQSSSDPSFFGKVGGCISQTFGLLNTEPWVEHGWTYYFYFTLLAEFVKALFAVLFLSIALDVTARFVENTEKLYLIQMIFIFVVGMIIVLNVMFGVVKLSKRYGTHDVYSEAQFSFLVTNLPIDSNPDEIKKLFTREVGKFLRHCNIEGSVKEVIFLQECGDYVALKKKKNAINEKIRNNEAEQKMYVELEKIEEKIRKIEQERENHEKFIGKAILILDSISTRNQMRKKLGLFWIKSLSLRVQGKMPSFWSIQEPSEMRYNYMHKFFGLRFFFATLLQLAISIGILAVVYLKTQNSTSQIIKSIPWVDSTFGLILLTAVPLISFKMVKGLNLMVPYFSLEAKYRSYAVHSFVNCVVTLFSVNLFLSLKTTKAVFLEKIIIGLLIFLGIQVKDYLLAFITEKFLEKNKNKSSTFDIWSGFNSAYQLIFLGICYLSLSPLIITSLLILNFLILIAVSGDYIRNFTSKKKLHPFQVGFSLYFLAAIMLFLFNLPLNYHSFLPDYYHGTIRQYSDKLVIICEGVLAVLLLVVRCYFKKGNNSAGDISYEQAKRSFQSCYSEQYPLYHIIKTKTHEVKLSIL